MTPWGRAMVAGLLLTGVWLEPAPEEAAMESTGRLSRVRSLSNTGQGKKLHVTMVLYIYTQDPFENICHLSTSRETKVNKSKAKQPTHSFTYRHITIYM